MPLVCLSKTTDLTKTEQEHYVDYNWESSYIATRFGGHWNLFMVQSLKGPRVVFAVFRTVLLLVLDLIELYLRGGS